MTGAVPHGAASILSQFHLEGTDPIATNPGSNSWAASSAMTA